MNPAALPVVQACPPEAAETALLVASRDTGVVEHARFDALPDHLVAGDVLVVNDSGTLPAALPARLNGQPVELRLSSPAPEGGWLVELRTAGGLDPFEAPREGALVKLPAGARARLLGRYRDSRRLSRARLRLGAPAEEYLARHGHPIRYSHAPERRPLADYQTVFARVPGSAEMPSAARPFTPELVEELEARDVLIAALTLHTGVSSLEHGEAPYPERFSVPRSTAELVNAAHGWGRRVIAVGTTVVRALETVADASGRVSAGAGFTELVITPERGVRAVDGLITGWHEPESTHLQLLEAVAGADLLERSYAAARAHGYRWHEFGDSHLILRQPV
jgi:S-adenosylmethionine:tRNA ribosyltransferase-isomerase